MDDSDPLNRFPNWVTDSPKRGSSQLNVHIFGPYRGEYHGILKEVVDFLQHHGYNGAKLATDLPNHPIPSGVSKNKQNWWESVRFMHQADAAIFVLLQPDEDRLDGAPGHGLNSSVFAELTFWAHFFADRKKGTLVFYEGEMKHRGSLVSGIVEVGGIEDMEIGFGEIDKVKNASLTTCINWLQ
ncbi:hypothetical protein [Haladaptatus sp. CMSO5]|uniref:hypothetical protein n=1 Tax=Haladaptatus sp. CMSO5 TaxID=3120514 RepID=UPI002FCE46E0